MPAQAVACCEFGKGIQVSQNEVRILIYSKEYCEVINSPLWGTSKIKVLLLIL